MLDSPLRFERFFQTLYLRYEERYLFGAPELKSATKRIDWAWNSPALAPSLIDPDSYPTLDYGVRCEAQA